MLTGASIAYTKRRSLRAVRKSAAALEERLNFPFYFSKSGSVRTGSTFDESVGFEIPPFELKEHGRQAVVEAAADKFSRVAAYDRVGRHVFVTTADAAMMAPSPIFTPGIMTERRPIQTSLPMMVLPFMRRQVVGGPGRFCPFAAKETKGIGRHRRYAVIPLRP